MPVLSIRVQIAIIFGGLTICLCAVASMTIGALMTSQIRRDSEQSLEGIAQTAAQSLASGLSQRLLETQILVDSTPLWSDGLDSPAVRQALARAQAAQKHNAWIGVADLAGKVESATSGLLLHQSVAMRPWFIEGSVGPHVGDVHRAQLLEDLLPKDGSGEPIRFVDFAAPIKINGKTVGVLGMHGTWDWARDVVSSLMPANARRRGLDLYIFDRQGKLLYSPRGAVDPLPRRDASRESADEAKTLAGFLASGGTGVVQWADGERYLTARYTLPAANSVLDLGWQIVAREPVEKAFEPARSASELAFGVSALVVVLAGWLAWWAAGMLGRPLQRLAKAATDVQRHVPGAEVPTLDSSREIQSLCGALTGMTERLIATYRAAPIGMCQLDLSGTVLDANDRLGEILEIPADSLLGRPLREFIASSDRFRLTTELAALARRRQGKISFESAMARGNGTELQVLLWASLVAATKGAPAYFVLAFEDISQRIAAEAADRANAAKSAFLSQVSHELRTPLNAVLGFTQLMHIDEADRLSARQAERLDAISGAGLHLLAMIDDLLDLGMVEADRLTLELQPVPVGEVVRHAVTLVSHLAQTAGIELTVGEPEAATVDHVLADRMRLSQVIANLLTNAIKYNRKHGSVNLSWRRSADGQRLALTVRDTGAGMDARQIEQLFQPFNRLGAERSPVQGTGIGLVITRKLIALMHGTLRVASEVGQGTRFTIELPLVPLASTPAATDFEASREPTAAATPRPRPKLVMYVEDNQVNTALMEGLMSMRSDVRLILASSGTDALTLARHEVPDLMLVDMQLGDMSGMELCARLRMDRRFERVPFVAVSADAMPASAVRASEAGFAGYLVKPFRVEELFRFVDHDYVDSSW